ncbi:MAG: hypothetical protein LBD75_02015 [Candidatus Peribacteria bacterium]|jgi:hypothetical protein|nr:hypothetical protein [Candidatus Peribacteria bacterium]
MKKEIKKELFMYIGMWRGFSREVWKIIQQNAPPFISVSLLFFAKLPLA